MTEPQAMVAGTRWMWSPHANGYTGFTDVPEPCTIVRETAFSMIPTRHDPHPEPFDYVVLLDGGGKVYARRAGLFPISAGAPPASASPETPTRETTDHA